MKTAALKPIELLGDPLCDRCGGKARLFGIEPHPTSTRTDVHTYVCTQCDAVRAEAVSRRPGWWPPPTTQRAAMPIPGLVADAAFDAETTQLLGRVFEAAWETVRSSGSAFADASHADSTRELLARRLIARAAQGERRHDLLVEDALDHLLKEKAA